jgi:hypothetical protein
VLPPEPLSIVLTVGTRLYPSAPTFPDWLVVEEVSFGDVEDAVDMLLPTAVVTSLVVVDTGEDTVDGEEVMLLTRGLERGGHLLAI